MAPDPPASDPVRATLVAVLQQLNRVESMNEGRARDQALGLRELERLLDDFWAVEHDGVKIPLVLGLLVRNRLVEVRAPDRNDPDSKAGRAHYHITADGKAFLVDAIQKTDRIA